MKLEALQISFQENENLNLLDHLKIVVGELNCEDSPQGKYFFFLSNQTEL